MATQLFTEILRKANIERSTQTATMWLREQAQSIRRIQTPEKKLFQEPADRLTGKVMIGHMYFFIYDAKTKDNLPYYDRIPLIFPFNRVKDGFYGINMHYLPHMLRAKLMDSLYDLSTNTKMDDSTRLRLSYQILNKAAKYRFFKPCVKHYLNSHVRSRFLWVPSKQWETALFLPLERFVTGGTPTDKRKVWRHSQRMLRK